MTELELLRIATNAAIEAGKAIMKIYNEEDFGVETKEDDSPLTKADIASNDVIMDFLKDTNIPVLSEEGKMIPFDERQNWKQLWIVDPIDGTKEFIKRNGEFTVNIALIDNQKPVLGVVLAPALNSLYFSSQTKGAFKAIINDESTFESIQKSLTSLPTKINRSKFTVVASRSHLSDETVNFIEELKEKHGELEFISIGSSLKLCLVAEGKADCYPRFAPTMEWDTAAGQAICNHAGFKVIDKGTNDEMLYNRENLLNNWFIVN